MKSKVNLVITMVGLAVAVTSQRAVGQVSSEVIGAGVVMHVRRPNVPLDPEVAKWLTSIPRIKPEAIEQIRKSYQPMGDMFKGALDNAERGLGGLYQVLGNSPMKVVLYPYPLPIVWESSERQVILITTGCVDEILALMGGFLIDCRLGSSQRQEGIGGTGLSEFLMSLQDDPTGRRPKVGEAIPEFTEQEFVLQRTLAAIVLQFIFGHELSHIKLNLPSSPTDSMAVEMRCDKSSLNGLLTFLEREGAGMNINDSIVPVAVVSWLVGQHLNQRVQEEDVKSMLNVMKAGPLEEIFPAMDWTSRAQQVVDVWLSRRSGRPLDTGTRKLKELAEKLIAQMKVDEAFPEALGGIEFRKQFRRLFRDAQSSFRETRGEEFPRDPDDDKDTPRFFGLKASLPHAERSSLFVHDDGTVRARITLASFENGDAAENRLEQFAKAISCALPVYMDFQPVQGKGRYVLRKYETDEYEGQPIVDLMLQKWSSGYEIVVAIESP